MPTGPLCQCERKRRWHCHAVVRSPPLLVSAYPVSHSEATTSGHAQFVVINRRVPKTGRRCQLLHSFLASSYGPSTVSPSVVEHCQGLSGGVTGPPSSSRHLHPRVFSLVATWTTILFGNPRCSPPVASKSSCTQFRCGSFPDAACAPPTPPYPHLIIPPPVPRPQGTSGCGTVHEVPSHVSSDFPQRP